MALPDQLSARLAAYGFWREEAYASLRVTARTKMIPGLIAWRQVRGSALRQLSRGVVVVVVLVVVVAVMVIIVVVIISSVTFPAIAM